MKARPYRQIDARTKKACTVAEATHILICCPGPYSYRMLPVGGSGWKWNGNTDKPTFTPSILTTGVYPPTDEEHARIMAGEPVTPRKCRCHAYVTDGRIRFLQDCTHEYAGQTLDLLDVD